MAEYFTAYGYTGLFIISFLAATILPVSSEAALAGLLIAGLNGWSCVILASVGNTLGGMVNYYLGRLGKSEWIAKYLKVRPAKIRKIQKSWAQKGAVSAFFSFLPGIGDIIPLALGYMRADARLTAAAMFSGKLGRYVLLMYVIEQTY